MWISACPWTLGSFATAAGKVCRQDLDVCPELLKDRQNDAFLLLDQRPKQMFRRNLRIALFLRVRPAPPEGPPGSST